MFQSAPDREAGRCSVGNEYGRQAMKFQSAPDREAGRCSCARTSAYASKAFQSAPDREAGRCVLAGRQVGVRLAVSIRARP